MSRVTVVTGLWDIGRSDLSEGWSRGYDHYIDCFKQILPMDYNMIIFGEESLRDVVFSIRTEENTQFIDRSMDWFKNEHYDKIQEIRKDVVWRSRASWLKDSTQAQLEWYNPLVMSKMFLLNDARILDKFDSKHLFWLDAGISNTVHPGYFTHDKVLDNIEDFSYNFIFVCYPYDADQEIHGFEIEAMNTYARSKVNKVARGGFFGGPKYKISEASSIYYQLMSDTLAEGLMGTEESLFTLMAYRHPANYDYFMIEGNGLLSHFFENLKNKTVEVKNESSKRSGHIKLNKVDTSLYVLTYNAPEQFKTLCDSMVDYDRDFIARPKKYLLNNSDDPQTDKEYTRLCKYYEFEEIKKDNLGVCGGRMFIAEHFDESGADFMFFFEDDMAFYLGDDVTCKNGFPRKINDLYEKALEITDSYDLDFLKLNFTEFYGDNSVQWSWYNVAQDVRTKFWPNNDRLPETGRSPLAPKTEFSNILSYRELAFATGEIYYCNWPQVVTKYGNKPMFLDTKWAHPYEQTWMSHIFQLTLKGEVKPGLLLATPTEHYRFDFYGGSARKEN